MSKAILISIKPKYVADILNGKKTIEIRKTKPNVDLPIDVYIYATKEKPRAIITDKGCVVANQLNVGGCSQYKSAYSCSGKVVAKFTLNKVEPAYNFYLKEMCDLACIELKDLERYAGDWFNVDDLYAWRIDNVAVFDEPRELGEFKPHCGYPTNHRITKAPQSYMFIEV